MGRCVRGRLGGADNTAGTNSGRSGGWRSWRGALRGTKRVEVEEVMGIGSREASLGCPGGTRVAHSFVSRSRPLARKRVPAQCEREQIQNVGGEGGTERGEGGGENKEGK